MWEQIVHILDILTKCSLIVGEIGPCNGKRLASITSVIPIPISVSIPISLTKLVPGQTVQEDLEQVSGCRGVKIYIGR